MSEPTIDVSINGQPRTLPARTSVAMLLAELGVEVDGVAVAVNLQVVPRSRHHEAWLGAGDRVEIIRAVGGG